MKIGGITPQNAISAYQGVQRKQEVSKTFKASMDHVEVSDIAHISSSAIKSVKASLTERTEEQEKRFAQIFEQVQQGTYDVDNNSVADKILGSLFFKE